MSKLKNMQDIDYSWGEIDFEVKPMREILPEDINGFTEKYMSGSYDLSIELDDINVSDTVKVI